MTVLLNIPIYKMSPSFFGKLASALNEVAPYVGNISGQSYDAAKTWNHYKGKIPEEVINQLRLFIDSGRKYYFDLDNLLKTI